MVGRVVSGTSQADYVQELSSCAENGAGITIGVGYELATAVDQAATMFPRASFAIVDVDVRTLTHRPANVEGLVFKQQEAGYLAGYTAGLWAARRGGKAVGSIGGLDIPPVDRALAGFRFGAKRASPGLTVLSAYSGDFAVPAKCQQQALEQIAKGSIVEFQVAGPCGAGASPRRGRRASPGSASVPTSPRSALHPDQRARAGRRRRRGRSAKRAVGAVGGRHQRDLRSPERGHHGGTLELPGGRRGSQGGGGPVRAPEDRQDPGHPDDGPVTDRSTVWPMRLAAALAPFSRCSQRGAAGRTRRARPRPRRTRSSPAPTSELRVGIVGPLQLHLAGVAAVHGTLARVADLPLVLVSNEAAGLAAVARAARANPSSHFALVGASTKGDRVGNLVGLVLRDEQAAQLAGMVAGYATADAGATAPRVAWVGPQNRRLAAAFAQGVHRALPGATVPWTSGHGRSPRRCKEAALAGIDRGAMVVAADRGLCAEAAVVAARQQNVPGLQLSDFESRDVVTSLIARDAAAGVTHGGEDLVFGAASGAIGVGALDPRISLATLVRARAAAQELASGAP